MIEAVLGTKEGFKVLWWARKGIDRIRDVGF